MLALIPSTGVNYALFLHVLGAMILVGALITAGTAQVLIWQRGSGVDAAAHARLAFKTLLFVAIPAYVAMRIGAEWVASKSGWGDVDPAPSWLDIGYITADLGGILLLVSVVLAGFGARRLAFHRCADRLVNALAAGRPAVPPERSRRGPPERTWS